MKLNPIEYLRNVGNNLIADAPNPTGTSELYFLWRSTISHLTHPTTATHF
ncbi:MAG: hypothetical protein JGK17_15640 [Microcoleus sp. PH2017_10_PVI_O_A]|nr:hypothetical protein [Microcoleus sp. PH2017_10_PVI_O_A]MCC3461067.1 hypothetical protein [Microcoleus sp. PH2017_11_PCY_U_A]MCC3479584.1 hypothetical protein [Microcoleus sp. PH2017_12_PCY_D_A]MCC3560429.1 hypothetical protein [Microcoleus sp. PH2017_27_LUM_O_A]